MLRVIRIFFSALFPASAFSNYWRGFGGEGSGMDFLWGAIVTMILAAAIYLYFPIAKKIKGKIAWLIIWLSAMIGLIAAGQIMYDTAFEQDWYRTWGDYVLFLFIWIPAIHVMALGWGKSAKSLSFSVQGRVRE